MTLLLLVLRPGRRDQKCRRLTIRRSHHRSVRSSRVLRGGTQPLIVSHSLREVSIDKSRSILTR